MFPTGLSMLWESAEPRSALQERFGHDSFDEASGWLTDVLAETWAIEVQACERIVISGDNAIAWVRTSRGALVVKWSRAQDQFTKFAAAADLIQELHQQGVPVAPPLASVDGQLRVIIGSVSVSVQPRIDGELLDITADAAVRKTGACLARLHGALAMQSDSRLAGLGRFTAGSLDLRRRVETWLQHEDTGRVPDASARLRRQTESLPPIDSEPQLIHNDYRASNILTAGSEVIAVLDFDEVGLDHCVSDLANACVLLGTRFTSWQPTPERARAALLAGYESVRPLSPLERQWLHALVLLRGIQAIPPGDDPAGWARAV
ncbi:phosphotransferase enzyme family protein [Arthrobacter sp. CDRTa11]|uniref:phosphotransferase enzyme family protein n=1 Tax=Arthrobacter sp. CDRTa11 TaxID=2651199 RepID=UPI002265BBF7|nr:phosphotransferase [Arthrobacter sp. CDRTa11]